MTVIEKLNSGAAFLRTHTSLPDNLKLSFRQISKGWFLLEEIEAANIDKKVRDCGWHYFRLNAQGCGWGVSFGRSGALNLALVRSLRKLPSRYNVAVIHEIRENCFLGLHIIRVEAFAAHIQSEPVLALSRSVGIISPGVRGNSNSAAAAA